MYQKEYFHLLNTLFKESKGKDFEYLRESLRVSIEIITVWDEWGPCVVCGRPQGEGRREREGFCRLKINPLGVRLS